jgi:hypothetical protein
MTSTLATVMGAPEFGALGPSVEVQLWKLGKQFFESNFWIGYKGPETQY